MGDIWLRGLGPAHINWRIAYEWVVANGVIGWNAKVLAAIAGPESGYDYHVINDTPATGDYSVGLWQINYYDGLYAERTRLFGTPRELAAGGPQKQAYAAVSIYHSQGFDAWYNTYHSGDWRRYIGTGKGIPIGGGIGAPPPPKELARDDWSGHIKRSASQFHHIGDRLDYYSHAIYRSTRKVRIP